MWFIRSKDKLVCGASVQWGILLFKSRLPPPFLLLSLPLYVYSHLRCTWQPPVVFAGEEKNKTALVKKSHSDKILPLALSLSVPGEAEEWKVPRPSFSAERLSKNKVNHMAANPGMNERVSSLNKPDNCTNCRAGLTQPLHLLYSLG